MKRKLTIGDVRAAVMGGAILGGGGGGHVDNGLKNAALALELGQPELWSADEFAPEAACVTVALVGTPSSQKAPIQPFHMMRALELARAHADPALPIRAINTNENGAETSINGWVQAALSGLPVIDLACNGRAHPTSLMGSLGLHRQPGYRSVQGFSGGLDAEYVEGAISGSLETASAVVRQASVAVGGFVSVARNPVAVAEACRSGAPGAISAAIALGHAYVADGVAGVCRELGGRVAAEGVVAEYVCERRDGLDVGWLRLDDRAGTVLRFVNEYLLLEQGATCLAAFPELIMTFSAGAPLVSAKVQTGMPVQVVAAPRERLRLSATMDMPELYPPLEALLGHPIRRGGAAPSPSPSPSP
ncbi:DUF917 family protein [Stenotrophomonas mori]|uniref:DUF917 family protein n=1 Tax=Stenotrophomonas mori TaxID=2871096 RepID=A0ABT0SGX7_9GAMM|nr:DUF917 family protein [Stenotrophomonas mori]MCL7714586.1 DUF917 family protein [Stenotrophomonas mori]